MIQAPGNENISVAESTRHSWDEEENRLAREYDLQVRKLELDVLKTENRINSWFKLPIKIILLPIYAIMAIGYCIAMIRKHEPPENFWQFLK